MKFCEIWAQKNEISKRNLGACGAQFWSRAMYGRLPARLLLKQVSRLASATPRRHSTVDATRCPIMSSGDKQGGSRTVLVVESRATSLWNTVERLPFVPGTAHTLSANETAFEKRVSACVRNIHRENSAFQLVCRVRLTKL